MRSGARQVEVHYKRRLKRLRDELDAHRDALRIDDDTRRRAAELTVRYKDNTAVAALAQRGPLYEARTALLVMGMERDRLRDENAALHASCITAGRQLIEAQQRVRELEQDARERDQRARDQRTKQQTLLDVSCAAACAALPATTEKTPSDVKRLRESLLEYYEQARTILFL